MSFIGIDLGTTFIKGAVLNLETRHLHHVRRIPFPPQLENTAPLACEFDPEEILAAVRRLIAELAPHAADCEGIVMCAQMHGMVLMDSRGEIKSNCVTWRDQRVLMPHPSGSESYYQVLRRRIDPEHVRQLGNELDPGRPVCYLFWFAEQGKLAPGLAPVSLPDFVLSVLCGSAPGVETTNAGAYGAVNLETLQLARGGDRGTGPRPSPLAGDPQNWVKWSVIWVCRADGPLLYPGGRLSMRAGRSVVRRGRGFTQHRHGFASQPHDAAP